MHLQQVLEYHHSNMATLIPLAVVVIAGPAIIALIFYRSKQG